MIEQGSWKTVYSKISYFPVDRKLYLAAKLVPGAAAAAGHMGITWLAFLAMALMKRPLAMEGMLLLTLSLAVSGVWFLAGFLVAMALAGEEESKFPGWGALLFLAFESGISLAYVICR